MNHPYAYVPLDPNRGEIRLFELFPARSRDVPISGRLFVVSLDDDQEYDALSYVWGDQSSRFNIRASDRDLSVGANLHHAFIDLRLPDMSRIIWADAICINQQDLRERDQQVQRMRDVYSKAEAVRVWLDHDADPSSSAFQALSQLGKGITLADHSLEFWRPALDVLRNPYWNRLWVQQELTVASRVVVHCRDNEFEGEGFLVIQASDEAVTGIGNEAAPGYAHAVALFMDVQHYIGPTGLLSNLHYARKLQRQRSTSSGLRIEGSLFHLFMASESLNMTDPKDRIYGLLGIALDNEGNDIEVRYDADLVEVYSQIARLSVAKWKRLEFLTVSGMTTTSGDDPSWFPSAKMDFPRAWQMLFRCKAAGRTTASAAVVHSRGRGLRLRGIMVDRVRETSATTRLDDIPVPKFIYELDQFCGMLWPNRDKPILGRVGGIRF